jgi:hypothetical protein
MTPSKSARNAEIVRRLDAGEKGVVLAQEFGLHVSRITQINRQRAKWEAATGNAGKVPADAPPGVRPRIKKAPSGLWECSDGIVSRAARTPQGAYQRWLTAAIQEAQHIVKAKPGRPKKAAPVAAPAWPSAVEVKPVARRQATVKGKSTDHLIPPRPPATAPNAEPLPAYDGPVTVLAGTAPRRALSLPTALQLNGARAAAVQPRMISIAGSAAREVA